MYDFRKDRLEGFIHYYIEQIKYKDCDPSIPLCNYIFDRLEYNIEQRLWMCWLYGNTYNLPTSYLIWNEFPDFENVSLKRLERFNTELFKKLPYQVDCKWSKGYLPVMYQSYKSMVDKHGSQYNLFKSKIGKTPQDTFNNLYNTFITEQYKFGRYCTWFYLQIVKHTTNLEMEPSSLYLTDGSSHSHKDGLLLALGRDDEVSSFYENGVTKTVRQVKKLTNVQVIELEKQADMILSESRKRLDTDFIDRFSLETSLCSYKKLFRYKRGRYIGYYLDRQSEEIMKVEENKSIEWKIFWDYRKEVLNKYNLFHSTISTDRMKLFLEKGIFCE